MAEPQGGLQLRQVSGDLTLGGRGRPPPFLPHLLPPPPTPSYKSCIPEQLRCQIQQHSFLTRKRIRRRVAQSLRRMGGCRVDGCCLKLKYLLDLERLRCCWAEESFHARGPDADIAIHVSADSGVSWSCVGSEVRKPQGGGEEGGGAAVGGEVGGV